MKGLLITLAVLFLLAWLPIGADLRYDGQPAVRLRLGPIAIRLIPKKKKKEADKKPKAKKAKEKKPKEKSPKKESAEATQKPSLGQTVAAAKPLIQVAVDALRRFRHILLFRELRVHLTFGADNAADAAIGYGRAWAAVGALTPMIENVFHVRKRDIQVFVDYEEKKVKLDIYAHLTIFLWQIFSFVLVYGLRGGLAAMKFMKLRKGGAKK